MKSIASRKFIIFFALPILVLISCATRIPVEVEHPPVLNTNGIKRIAVMPFEANNSDYKSLAAYATSAVIDAVSKTNRFTLVDAAEVKQAQKYKQNANDYVDAMIVGQITKAFSEKSVERNPSYMHNKNRDGDKDKDKGKDRGKRDGIHRSKVHKYNRLYTTSVEIEFTYYIKRALDGELIGPISRKGTLSAQSTDDYPSEERLFMEALNKQIAPIAQDIAPYKVKEIRTFAEDKTGNEVIEEEMKYALTHVKTQNYKLALDAYIGIYERYKSVAAAENASIIYEAMGAPEAALSFMNKVYSDTGNPSVHTVITRLNSILANKAKVN